MQLTRMVRTVVFVMRELAHADFMLYNIRNNAENNNDNLRKW